MAWIRALLRSFAVRRAGFLFVVLALTLAPVLNATHGLGAGDGGQMSAHHHTMAMDHSADGDVTVSPQDGAGCCHLFVYCSGLDLAVDASNICHPSKGRPDHVALTASDRGEFGFATDPPPPRS